MSSVVDICNMALGNIHASSINSLTEASLEAQQCKLRWPYARKAVLRDAPWNFARTVVAMALTTHEPQLWNYAYRYPVNCLRAGYIPQAFTFRTAEVDGLVTRPRYEELQVPPERRVPYEVGLIDGDKVVLTDEPEAHLVYLQDIEDPNLYDSQFIIMASHYLASAIAVPIIGGDRGRKMKSDEMELYRIARSQAQATNANERHRQREPESQFVTGRD